MQKRTQSKLVFSMLLMATACDASAPKGSDSHVQVTFAELEVGQEWLYAKWQKRYGEALAFTGDTLSILVTFVDAGTATLFERRLHAEAQPSSDSTTFQFEVSDSLFKQVGANDSRLFGFVTNHGGRLFLSGIDSNKVVIDLNASLFSVREQTKQSKFIGHADEAQLLYNTYQDVIVYYDETPSYVDGFGHIAIVSNEFGIASTIFFGGFSPIEAFGYELVR